MVVPRPADCGAALLTLHPITSHSKPSGSASPPAEIAISRAEIEGLARVPLTALPLGSFVSESRGGRPFCHDGLPFSLSAHPAAKGHVATEMLERLQTDLQRYAKTVARRTELHLSRLAPTLNHAASPSACNHAIKSSESLRTALTSLHQANVESE